MSRDEYKKELIQVAAVAVAAIEGLEGRISPPTEGGLRTKGLGGEE